MYIYIRHLRSAFEMLEAKDDIVLIPALATQRRRPHRQISFSSRSSLSKMRIIVVQRELFVYHRVIRSFVASAKIVFS